MDETATKEDIKKLATKVEVRQVVRSVKQVEGNLRGEILRVEERVETIEDGQQRIEAKVDRVLHTLDYFSRKARDAGNRKRGRNASDTGAWKASNKLETSRQAA